MKLAIIDLDGVVADATARFAKAEEVKQAYVERASNDLYAADEREATNIYWRAVFNPEYVPLDVPMAVDEDLEVLDRQHWQILYLTSRPESMREATEEWLNDHSLYAWSMVNFPGSLIMKAPAFQYVKTIIWKAGMIHSLAALAGATELLVIDDEQANLNEVVRYTLELPDLVTAKSLAEAVAKLNGTWVEPDPFLPPE